MLFAGVIVAFVALFLMGSFFEAGRHSRGYARIGEDLGAEPTRVGKHARWPLWGLTTTVEGCEVDVHTALGHEATELLASVGMPSPLGPLATRIRVKPAHGALVRGALCASLRLPGDPHAAKPGGYVFRSKDESGRLCVFGNVEPPAEASALAAMLEEVGGLVMVDEVAEVWLELPTNARKSQRIIKMVRALVAYVTSAANEWARLRVRPSGAVNDE